MKALLSKPFAWAVTYSLILFAFTVYVLLDTFVISDNQQSAKNSQIYTDSMASSTENADITDNSYTDENISINISSIHEYDTDIYVADIKINDIKYLKTAFANNTYGRNIKDTTSDMAKDNNALFAVNGDYYGFRDYGFVVRNGTLYRDTAGSGDALVIYNDGTLSSVTEKSSDAQALVDKGAVQILSFGPSLIESRKIVVGENTEVGKAMTSNPRTAIGMISPLHYIIIVSDGRTDESKGLSLYELSEVLFKYNCTTAYNLDGGGSSTMWFNGSVINSPTDGRSDGERKVSDIVYIG